MCATRAPARFLSVDKPGYDRCRVCNEQESRSRSVERFLSPTEGEGFDRPVARLRSQSSCVLVVLVLAMTIAATTGSGARSTTARFDVTWRLLAYDREAGPPGPPGLTAVTAEVSVPAGERANRHSVRIRVVAQPADLRPYVSWHVGCGVGHPSFSGDGFHMSSFTQTVKNAPNCEADVTATLYFWKGASNIRVWIYGR